MKQNNRYMDLKNHKNKRLLQILFLIFTFTILVVGICGSINLMYTQTEIEIEHHKIASNWDNIPLEMNYIKPNHETSSKVGIIIAHGFSSDRWGVFNFGLSLARAGIHVVSMDHRGHGDSEGFLLGLNVDEPGLNSSELYEATAFDFLTEWQFLRENASCDSIYIAGHSMGGFSATRFAMKFPDLINGTIILGATMPFIGEDLNEINPKNALFLIGSDEELFTRDSLLETLRITTNNSSAEFGNIYGNFENGTARKAEIIQENGQYLGHVQEPIKPQFFQATLDWINQTSQVIGEPINYNMEQQSNITQWINNITIFQTMILIACFLIAFQLFFFLPIISIYKRKFIPEMEQKQINENDVSQKSTNWKPIALLIIGEGIFSALGLFLTTKYNIFWIPIKRGSYFFGGILFMTVFSLLWWLIFQLGKREGGKNRKFNFKEMNHLPIKILLIEISLGIIFGLTLPFLFQISTIYFDIPNLLGGFPTRSDALIIWMIISLTIFFGIYPESYLVQSFQNNSIKYNNRKEIILHFIRFISLKSIQLILFSIFCYFLLDSSLTFSMTVGFYAAIIIFQILGFVQFYLYPKQIPILIFTGITVGWIVIINLIFDFLMNFNFE